MRYFSSTSDTSDTCDVSDTSSTANSSGASKASASVTRLPSYFLRLQILPPFIKKKWWQYKPYRQCKPRRQCKPCQQCNQHIARCYLRLWWYFLRPKISSSFVKKKWRYQRRAQIDWKRFNSALNWGTETFSDLMCMTQDGDFWKINAEQFKDILAEYSLNTKNLGTKYCHFFKKEKKIKPFPGLIPSSIDICKTSFCWKRNSSFVYFGQLDHFLWLDSC